MNTNTLGTVCILLDLDLDGEETEVEVELEIDADAGSPARLSGPPEMCDPGEPPTVFDIVAVAGACVVATGRPVELDLDELHLQCDLHAKAQVAFEQLVDSQRSAWR